MSAPTIDTKTVSDRRALRFASSADVLSDVRRLLDAEKRGTLRRTGNWTLGQNLGHLAAWIEYGYTGFPMKPPSLLMRLIIKLMKKKFLSGPPIVGFRIPGVAAGTYATEDMPAEVGFEKLSRAWQRLDAAPPADPNPAFGKLTHEEWKMLHLRHAEGHLGFLHP
jgi:hypothetical protein